MKRVMFMLVTISVVIASAIAGYIFSEHLREQDSNNFGSSLAASIAQLIEVGKDGDLSKETKRNISEVIREDTLLLIALAPNFKEFDANGFAGMCRLVSERDEVFHNDNVEPVWQQAIC